MKDFPEEQLWGPQVGTQLLCLDRAPASLLRVEMGTEAQRLNMAFPVLRQHALQERLTAHSPRGPHLWALHPLSTDAEGQGQGTLE